MKNKIKIISLIGPAGSGKDTIVHQIIKKYPNLFHEVISCTTRPPREGEKDGVNYHFLTVEQFIKKIYCQEILEYTLFNSWHYGTERSSLSKEKINIGVFNPEGVRNLMKYEDIDLKVFYVRADDKQRLLRQLNREENPNVQEIICRFSADQIDFHDLSDINYKEIYNNTLEDLTSSIDAIMAEIN